MTRTSKFKKSELVAFQVSAQRLIEACCEVSPPGRQMYPYRCMTQYGRMLVKVSDYVEMGPTVFMRFQGTDEQRKAAGLTLDSNPFSGKWNIHGTSTEDTLLELQRRFQLVEARRLDESERAAWDTEEAELDARWTKAMEHVTETA